LTLKSGQGTLLLFSFSFALQKREKVTQSFSGGWLDGLHDLEFLPLQLVVIGAVEGRSSHQEYVAMTTIFVCMELGATEFRNFRPK